MNEKERKLKEATWNETVIVDIMDNILVVLVNQMFYITDVNGYTLEIGDKKYGYLRTTDVIDRNNKKLQRKIHVIEIQK